VSSLFAEVEKDHSADKYSKIKNESEHDIAFKKLLDILHHDLLRTRKRLLCLPC
jgi:hypothetical protein